MIHGQNFLNQKLKSRTYPYLFASHLHWTMQFAARNLAEDRALVICNYFCVLP
jgi:hypothetical protein